MFSRYEEEAKKRGYRVDKFGHAFNKHNREVGTIGCRGYRYFAFRDENNKIIKVYIHRMQAYQKYGKRLYQDGILVRHLDGNSLNNHRDNIAIGTALDNHYDKPYSVRSNNNERLRLLNIKYSNEKVIEIQNKHKAGFTYKQLMKEYGINSKGTMSYIINHRGGV